MWVVNAREEIQVLLFDSEYRNGTEGRTSVAREHPEIVKQIRRLLDESAQPTKYLTLGQ